MKKLLVFCLFTLGVSVSANAQTNVNADCINAIPLCSNPNFTFFPTSGVGAVVDFSTSSLVSNPITDPFPPNAGCLKSGELNPQWLLLTVGNAGVLEFVFGAGTSANPQAGYYDWSMWPYSPTTCVDILNNTLAPVRCNWNASSSGGTGIASSANVANLGGTAGNYEAPLQVNACQQFIICISNFSGVNTLVSFQSLGTASLSCNPNCNPNYSTCAGGSATIVPVNFAALTNPSFSMQPGGVTNTTGSFVVTPSVTSSYTTFITGLNSVNAVQTITSVSTVTVFPQPVIAPTVTQSTCSSSLTTINAGLTFTPSASSYTLLWSPLPNGINTATQTTVTAFQNGGPYQVTVTSAAGCSATASFTVDPTPSQPQINLAPSVTNYSLTCFNPVITYTALDAANSYTWYNGSTAPINGQFATFSYTDQGTYTITAADPNSGCTVNKIISIGVNTITPTATLSPLLQNVTCVASSFSNVNVVASPSVNALIYITTPLGGTFVSQSYSTAYLPGSVGDHTCFVLNSANGCSTAIVFTVTSNQGFPTFSLSSPQNYTLGCTTKSVATININNGTGSPPGSAVSYTLIPPGASSVLPTGTLSGQSVYTVNAPGLYTVVTKDNVSLCETRQPISILSNTIQPDLQAIVPYQILDCAKPRATLKSLSENSNVSYEWKLPGGTLTQPGDTLNVVANYTARTQSLVGNFTLVVTDNSSTCESRSVIPIYQNLYLPNVQITNGGVPVLTCKTRTTTLTNLSTTGILAGTGFSTVNPVVAQLWQGPSPQINQQLTTTYLAGVSGIYTLTVKDLNNFCTQSGTISIGNNIVYPVISFSANPILDCGTGAATISPAINYSVSGKMSYTITPPPGGTVSPLTSSTPSFVSFSLGQHRLLALNAENGCSSSEIFKVEQGTITANFVSDVTEGFAPLTVNFTNKTSTSNSTLTNSGADKTVASIWNFGNGTASVVASPTIPVSANYLAPGNYTIAMYVKSGACSDTASTSIKVKLASDLEVPNVFTPNGDGNNDVYFLHAPGMQSVDLQITDRWGKFVYHVVGNEGNVSWDGKRSDGTECSDGVYFYVLKATGVDGKTYDQSGTITLLR